MSGSGVQEIIDRMGILRMLRLARVVRLVRMVRLIPELKSLVYLILSSMGAFIWTIVLMLILMYCVAVYFTQIATDMRAQKEVPPDIDVIVRYWGTIENSIMSLFMAITGGDDWRNLSEVFLNKPGSLTNQLFFSCYIAWASLVMLNLVTGVFVEGAQRIVGEDRRKETVRLAAKFFVEADLDNSEELSLHEFEELVGCGKMDEFLSGLGISVNDANALFQSFDEDGSGDISLVEFVEGCLRLGATSTYQDTMILKCNQMALTNKVEEFSSRFEELSKRSAQLNDLLRFVVSGGRSGRLPIDMLPLSEEIV
jgi:Ca2+-binding EF-hand superfamily protein